MRRALLAVILALGAACHTADNDPSPPASGAAPNEVRVLNGPAECDACDGLSMLVGGPGVYDAASAVLETRSAGRQPIAAVYQLRRFTGDSGKVLEVGVAFTDMVPAGEYALRVRMPSGGDLVVERALVMTNAYIPDQVTRPPTDSVPVQLLATVTGQDPDSVFQVRACGDFSGCRTFQLRAGIPVFTRLASEDQLVELLEVSANCTVAGGSQRLVGLRSGDAQTAVLFEVACTPLAFLRLQVTATGPDADEDFLLTCLSDSCGFGTIGFGSGTVVAIAAGTHDVVLDGVSTNCSAVDDAYRTITVAGGDTLLVPFTLSCVAHGVVRVSTRTTGTNLDGVYTIVDFRSCDYYWWYGCTPYELVEPAVLEFSGPGMVHVQLGDVAANCTVPGGLQRVVSPPPGSVTDVVFEVECR